MDKRRLANLNTCSGDEFVAICGPFFENSPWIAQRNLDKRPFKTRDDLHRALARTVNDARNDELCVAGSGVSGFMK